MKLVVEGWRGIDSSFALVNQCQLLELLRRPGIDLRHRDVPMYETWAPRVGQGGLEADAAAQIAAIPAPEPGAADAVYRLSFPYQLGPARARRLFVFMTSENHVFSEGHFQGGAPADYRRNGLRVIAPSAWSREGIAGLGFAPEDIAIVPHGVDAKVFRPLAPEERARAREALGVPPDHVLFANVSAMTDNKGVDKLVLAFATLRRKYRKISLVLKDQPYLYPNSAAGFLEVFRSRVPQLATRDALEGIRIVSAQLPRTALRDLYGAADVYVSPYRSEGFNLPPLEAAACGTPCLLSAGGATDDYFHPSFAARIETRRSSSPSRGVHVEPSLDHLVALMEGAIEGRPVVPDAAAGARWVAEHWTWGRAVDRLVAVLEGSA